VENDTGDGAIDERHRGEQAIHIAHLVTVNVNVSKVRRQDGEGAVVRAIPRVELA
jgi:hypothetical protein